MVNKSKRLPENLIFHIPDLQVPFHDKRALALVNLVIEDLKPSCIRQKGDMIDCYKESDYVKNPDIATSVEEECDVAYDIWKEWVDLSPGCELEWEEGNHEFRWERLRRRHGIKKRSLRTIPELLQKDADGNERPDLEIGWIPKERQPCMVGNWLSMHGSIVRKHSAYTAKAMADSKWTDIIVAHTHRIGTHAKTLENGRIVMAHECGCLCQYDAEYIEGHPNWQHAFAIHHMYPTHDDVKIYPIFKLGKKYYVTVHGKLYSK
jgi:hypothetical protein